MATEDPTLTIPGSVLPLVNQLLNTKRAPDFLPDNIQNSNYKFGGGGEDFNPKTRFRNTEVMRQEALYEVSITRFIGKQSKKINPKRIPGLPEAIADKLESAYKTNKLREESGIEAGPMSIFRSLGTAAAAIDRTKRKIQTKYFIYAEPFWFVPESKLTEVRQELEGLKQQAYQARDEALLKYNSDHEDYLARVARYLYNAGLGDEEVAISLPCFDTLFPSYEECKNSFSVVVRWGGRVPSLIEQGEEEVRLKEILARDSAADAELRRQQEEARFRLEDLQNRRRASESAIAQVKQEILELVEENLTALQKSQFSTKIHPETKAKAAENLKRLEVLCNFSGELGQLVSTLKKTSENSENSRGVQLQHQINQLRQQLAEATDQVLVGNQISEFDREFARLEAQIAGAMQSGNQVALQHFVGQLQEISVKENALIGIMESKKQDLRSKVQQMKALVLERAGLDSSEFLLESNEPPQIELLEDELEPEPVKIQEYAIDTDAGF